MNADLSNYESAVFTRMVSGQERKERRYAIPCSTCGATRWTTAQSASKSEICQSCSASAKGRKGYESTVKKYGKDFFFEKARERELNNPSAPERLIIEILCNVRCYVERQVPVSDASNNYLIDFVINGRWAVEYDGWHHQHYHSDRDQRKHAAMIAAGYNVLHITEADFADGVEGVQAMIEQFIRSI